MGAESKTLLTALIPTVGREREVIDTVRALLGQTRIPDEILVVDQNRPGIPELDAFLDQLPLVRHIRSPGDTVVFNLNLGLKEARGEILLVLDDDVEIPSNFVERHLANYSGQAVGGVAGRVEQPSGDLPQVQIHRVGHYSQISGEVTANFNSNERRKIMFAPGGNMSFLKRALIAAGGFDLGFEGNAYFFEPDLGMRVGQAGYEIVFDPAASLKHLMAPAGGCRITDKAEHTFYFVRNGFRRYRRFSPALGLPLFILKSMAYVTAKSIYNKNIRIFTRGLAAICQGLTQDMALKANTGDVSDA